MSDWKQYCLDDLAYFYNGKAFKPSDWREDGIKIIRIEQLNNPEGEYDYFQGEFPEINKIENDDLIFSWSATLKVLIWQHGNAVLNQHLFKVVPKEFVDKQFLYFLLDFNMGKIGDTSHGSTMKHIKRGELKRFFVKIPFKTEQRKIATILSTVDGQIEKTEAIIAKYQAIKQGMLHDLFTRGIDTNTGKLRPKYEDAPELYKPSKLGMVPKEWEVEPLELLTEKIGSGVTPTGGSEVYTNSGILFIRSQNVLTGNLSLEDAAYISYKIDALMENSRVRAFDVLLNITGASIGRSAYYPIELPSANVNQHVCIIRFKNVDKKQSVFATEFLNSDFGQKQIGNSISGGNREGLNFQQIKSFHFPVFTDLEMEKLVKIIEIENEHLISEQKYLQKLKSLKSGLMNDLLSGKKIVKVFENKQDRCYG